MLIYLMMLEETSDKEWFAKLYDSNYRKMYSVVYAILQNVSDTENAVHDAFLSIAERIERYKGLGNNQAMGLCILIAKNKAIDILRYKKHFSEVDVLEYVVEYEPMHDPEENVMIQEEKEKFRRLLSQLPEVLSSTLILKYYYEYNNREIADILNISKKTVEMRLYRGKEKLRCKILEEELYGRDH